MKKIILLLAFFHPIFAKDIVSTSIIPNKFFIEQIAKDFLEVNVLVPIGANVHTYEPKASQMQKLSKSKFYFANGVEFEEVWLDKFKDINKDLIVINIDENVNKLPSNHSSKHKEVFDAHIWTDPIEVKTQAKNIALALIEVYPDKKEFFEKNLEEFLAQIDLLDEYIKENLKDIDNKKFIIQHPSWSYFAKRYDLEQIAIEFEGKDIKAANLAKLIDKAKVDNIKMLVVSPNFSSKNAQIIKNQLPINIVSINELDENWLQNLKNTADIFKKNLK